MDKTVVYQSLIGGLQWAVALGRIDMAVSVNTMSSFRAGPRQGHLDRVERMCGYLAAKKSAAIRVRTDKPDYSAVHVPEFNWERIYRGNSVIVNQFSPCVNWYLCAVYCIQHTIHNWTHRLLP